MRTSTGVSAGLRTGFGLAVGGCCLLASLSACGDGRAAGALPAVPAARAPGDPMAPAVDDAGAALPSPADVTVSAAQDGGQVALPLGHSLAVTLEGNPTTGYVWELDQVDTNVLRRDGEVTYTPSQVSPTPQTQRADKVGIGGTFTARFTAVRPGDTWLKLIYHRPFQHGGSPERIFTAHVTVAPV